MIGAELQSLRAELVAPPAARAHRRSSFAALKADLVELKKRGGVDEDALAYVKQDIATYVRELREEAKPDAFDGDNANAMREELRILQKELADVRDAQARRPASPRSPRSPRTPRPADESALEKLSDQLSSLQATIAAPPRAIEERRRTYATITSDLEQLKRNRGEPDDRLKSRIAKYVREINEERPREGLDFDDANVAEMREELKHLTEKLKEVEAARDRSPPRTGRSSKSSKSSKSSRRDDVLSSLGDQLASLRQDLAAPAVSRQHRRTSYANMKQDLAVLKDRAAAGRELSGDALATVKHDLAAYVEDLKSNTMTQTASDRDETREELRNLQATLAAIPKGDSTSADVMAAFAQQLASLQAAVAAPPQARQHRRTSFANLMSDVEQLKLKSATRDAPRDDAARVAAEVKAFIKEIKEEAPRRDEDYDADNANEMKRELKSVTEALSSLAGNPDVAALRAEVASLRGALASPDDRKRKATYANLQKDVDELRSRRKSAARSASPKPVDERKLLDAMQAQFRAYADDLKREIKSGHDSDDVKRELANLHRGLADLKESPRFHGPEAEAPISAIFKEIEQLREEQRRVPEAQPPAQEPRKQRRMTYDKIAMDLDRLKLDVAATAERERHLEEREDRLEDRLLNSGRGRDDDAVSTAVVALESRLGAYFGALKSDLEQSSRQASARDEATSELESLKRQAPASVSRAPSIARRERAWGSGPLWTGAPSTARRESANAPPRRSRSSRSRAASRSSRRGRRKARRSARWRRGSSPWPTSSATRRRTRATPRRTRARPRPARRGTTSSACSAATSARCRRPSSRCRPAAAAARSSATRATRTRTSSGSGATSTASPARTASPRTSSRRPCHRPWPRASRPRRPAATTRPRSSSGRSSRSRPPSTRLRKRSAATGAATRPRAPASSSSCDSASRPSSGSSARRRRPRPTTGSRRSC